MDSDQTAPIGAVCSGSLLFAYILNSSVMLGNYLQQTTSADDIFRCIFFVLFILTLNMSIATKVVCFSCLLKCLSSLYGKQCGSRSDCCYRSSLFRGTLFASILNSSVMLGNYLQQTTSADDIFRCIFFLAL